MKQYSLLKKDSFLIFVLIIVIFVGYSFVLGAPFKTMDDEFSITRNEQIKDFKNMPDVFKSSFFGGKAYYRPLVALSFMAEYHMFEDRPLGYYLDNIILHCLSAVIVFFLVSMLLSDRMLGFFTALFFAVHPVHWEAVSNISGRSILMCAFFALTAILNFFKYYKNSSIKYLILSLVCFSLALLSKESAVMLPVVLFCYLLIVESKPLKKTKELLPFFIIAVGYVFLRNMLGITNVFYWDTLKNNILGFATFARGIGTYLRIFILPVDLHFDRSLALFGRFASAELWTTLSMYVLVVSSFVYFYKKIPKLVVFLVGWFFIELFPVSQIVVSVGVQAGYISIAEHFLYVASIPVFILFVLGGQWVYKKYVVDQGVARRSFLMIAGCFYVFFFLTAVQQNMYSKSERQMLSRSLYFSPNNVRIRNSLALGFAKEGLFREAEEHFREVLEIAPQNIRARVGLGKALCDQGKCLEGLQEYDKIQEAGNLKELLDDNRILTVRILINEYKKLLSEDAKNAQGFYSLGVMYSKVNEPNNAIKSYRRAISIEPNYKNALFNLASTLEGEKHLKEAGKYYKRMLSLEGGEDWMDEYAREHMKGIDKD